MDPSGRGSGVFPFAGASVALDPWLCQPSGMAFMGFLSRLMTPVVGVAGHMQTVNIGNG